MYTVCIKNTGSSSVNSISLADSSLTNGLSNVQYLSGNSWCPWTGSCTVSSLAPGCSTTVRIGGYVTSASGSTISNQISLRGNASVCWRDGSNGAVSTSLCSQPVCEPPTYPTGYNFPSHYPVLSGPDANGCYVYNIVALTPGYGLINYGLLDAFGNPIWSEVSCSGTAWPGGTCPQGCNC